MFLYHEEKRMKSEIYCFCYQLVQRESTSRLSHWAADFLSENKDRRTMI